MLLLFCSAVFKGLPPEENGFQAPRSEPGAGPACLLLDEVQSEARDFILEVDGLELAVLVVGGGLVKLEALALHVSLGALDEVGLDADVALRAAERSLHDFDAGAGEDGFF